MRVLLWHGWLLEGSGSNVYTAKVAEANRRAGHSVLILCQEPHPERFSFIDEWGTVDADRVSLANEDRSGRHEHAAVALHAEPLRVAVAAVARGAACLLVCHRYAPSIFSIRTAVKFWRWPCSL